MRASALTSTPKCGRRTPFTRRLRRHPLPLGGGDTRAEIKKNDPLRRFQLPVPSQRQLRVGELVRHALADVFARGEAGTEFEGVLVSIAEVRMSPDLKHATALVAPLAVTRTPMRWSTS